MTTLIEWIKKHQKVELYSEIVIFMMMYAGMKLISVFIPMKLHLKEICLWFFVYAVINQVLKDLKWKKIFVTVFLVLVAMAYLFLHSYGMHIEVMVGIMWYILLKSINLHDMVRIIYTFSLTLCMVTAYILEKNLQKNVIAIILLLLLKEIIGFRKAENGLRLFPVLFLMEMVVFLIPTNEKPFDWSFVIETGKKIQENCEDFVLEVKYLMKDKLEFGDMTTGYSGEGKFGGKILDSDEEELYVTSKATVRNLYISGREFSTLNGDHWEKSNKEEPYGFWYAKYLNTLYQAGITKEEAGCFSQICRTEYIFGYLKTNHVFHNTYILNLKPAVLQDMTQDKNDFQFKSVKKKKYAYPIAFLDFDYSNEYLRELLYQCEQYENTKWADYDTLDKYAYELYCYHLSSIMSEVEYNAFAKNNGKVINASDYVTNNASNRVKRLAKEITEGKNSDYEKALAIEDYLRRNYTYSKEADNSQTDDVIDYFLFESKTGYCMHYASAMVILLQLNGIPTRYVEGYLCDYKNQNENEGSYYLTASNSHAWPEAYVKGFGWVRFEPTSSYGNSTEAAWNRKIEDKKGIIDREIFTTEEVKPEVSVEKLKKKNGRSTIEIFGSVILFISLFVIALCVIYLVRRKEVYKKKSELDKLEAQIRDMEWLIMHLYPGNFLNKPLLDYVAAIKDRELQDKIEKICYIYYHAKYGKALINMEDWDDILTGKEELYQSFLQLEKHGKLQRKWLAFWRLETC